MCQIKSGIIVITHFFMLILSAPALAKYEDKCVKDEIYQKYVQYSQHHHEYGTVAGILESNAYKQKTMPWCQTSFPTDTEKERAAQRVRLATTADDAVKALADLRRAFACGYDPVTPGDHIYEIAESASAKFGSNNCISYWVTQVECIWVQDREFVPKLLEHASSLKDFIPANCPTLVESANKADSATGAAVPSHR